eukprot:COSAG05_NODE_793_length_7295_cov_2.666481_9_plen_117_part_00
MAQVGPPTLAWPSHRYRPPSHTHGQRSPAAAMRQYTTHAGEALYIPLGWRHYAAAAATPGGATLNLKPVNSILSMLTHRFYQNLSFPLVFTYVYVARKKTANCFQNFVNERIGRCR